MQVVEDHDRAIVSAIWKLDALSLATHGFHGIFRNTNILI